MDNMKPLALYKEGSLSSPIAFIGEAPGEQEVGQAKPFVGNAGMLLNTLMHGAGILRGNCYIDNVFQFRPMGNDITPFLSYKNNMGIESPEFKEAKQSLTARLQHSDANVFIPLGNTALYTLTGKWSVTKYRGSVLPCILPGLENRKVIPTIHPSHALTSDYLARLLIAFDLVRIKKQSLFPDIRTPYRNLMVSPTYIEALQYLDYANHKSQVGFDIEVMMTTKHLSCFSIAVTPQECMSIPLIESGKGDYFDPDQEGRVLQALVKLLEDPLVTKVGQNIIFDSSFMFKRYGAHMNNMEDTMIAMGILYPDYPKDLAMITSLYTEEPYYKDEGKMYMKNPFGDDLTFRRYNAKDSAVCLEAFYTLQKDLKSTGNYDAYTRQRALIDPLLFMQEHGILMDTAGLAQASIENQQKIEDSQAELDKMCGYPINIRSAKQMKEYFYVHRGYKPKYHGDALTVDNEALNKLAAQGSPEARLIQKLRHLYTIQSNYFEMKLDPDDRMRNSFNPIGTKQGRTSSSQTIFGTGGNQQKSPKEFKKFMLADPGYIICNMDLAQAENRVVAYISNELKMIAAFEAGIDLHRLTASLIFHKSIEQVSSEKGSSTLGSGQMSERDWGKRANHALNYDLGISKFAAMYEVSNADAGFIIDQYHRAYPGVRQWHAAIRDQLAKDRKLTNCFGRMRQFRDRWNEDLFKEAYSYIPQSTVADAMNTRGIVWMYKQQADIFKPVRLLNLVHDSIVFEYPLSEGPEALARICMLLKANLEHPITWRTRSFTIPADLGVGFNMLNLTEYKSPKYTSVEQLTELLQPLYNG